MGSRAAATWTDIRHHPVFAKFMKNDEQATNKNTSVDVISGTIENGRAPIGDSTR